MNVGDLVKHAPVKGGVTEKLYTDWGHEPDFKAGIVIERKGEFRRVLPSSTGKKPAWYDAGELVVLSKVERVEK